MACDSPQIARIPIPKRQLFPRSNFPPAEEKYPPANPPRHQIRLARMIDKLRPAPTPPSINHPAPVYACHISVAMRSRQQRFFQPHSLARVLNDLGFPRNRLDSEQTISMHRRMFNPQRNMHELALQQRANRRRIQRNLRAQRGITFFPGLWDFLQGVRANMRAESTMPGRALSTTIPPRPSP